MNELIDELRNYNTKTEMIYCEELSFRQQVEFFSSSKSSETLEIKSPEFRILNNSLSPSSPYFPIKVGDNSNEGVSIGENPYFS